jgi:hypothetical protein
MNIQQLRQSLKMKWLNYYKQNRPWLVKMRVWATYNGLRRPSSGFILATLSVLEPEFDQILAFMVDLNNNPDAIVTALGLNFNPDEELHLTNLDNSLAINQSQNQSLEVTHLEETPTINEIVPQPLAKLPDTEKISADLPKLDKPFPGFAVTTKVSLPSSAKRSRSVGLSTGVLPQTKPVHSFALTTTVPSNAKTLALAIELNRRTVTNSPSPVMTAPISRAIAPEIPNQTRIPLLALNPEITNNSKLEKLQPQNLPSKKKPFSHTNARSLASWVDEFCQGKAWEEESIIGDR